MKFPFLLMASFNGLYIYIHRIYGSLVRDPKKTHLYLGGGNSNIFYFSAVPREDSHFD